MPHKNYFEIEAETNYELGARKGELFGDYLRESLEEERGSRRWDEKVRESAAYLAAAEKTFPHLIEELRGYAHGARTSFEELWTLNLDDELSRSTSEKCTTIVTNNGYVVAHSEDWAPDAKDAICVLLRKVGNSSAFELFYLNTLGGNAASVNSHGIVQSINSLDHTDRQVGVPKNVVARWLSDTDSPERACRSLAAIKRASGYHHLLLDSYGRMWSIECGATDHVVTKPSFPFVHTNHFLADGLSGFEGADDRDGTFHRYQYASSKVLDFMSLEKTRELISDDSQGRRRSILNRRTIAQMIVDVDHMVAYVWLRRERDRGWVSYPLDFGSHGATQPF